MAARFGLDIGISMHFVSDQAWVEPTFKPSDPSGFDTTPLPVPSSVMMRYSEFQSWENAVQAVARLRDSRLAAVVGGTGQRGRSHLWLAQRRLLPEVHRP